MRLFGARQKRLAQREIEGFGMPVLVCMYGSGQTPAAGRQMLQKLIDAAAGAGLTDSLVIDHPEFSGTASWAEYIASSVARIDAEEKHRGRPVVMCAAAP